MSTGSAPLKRLWRQPTFRLWSVTNLFTRLPLTMNLLGLILIGEEVTGSLAPGAQLAGILTIFSGLFAMQRGRALDRVELGAGLTRDLRVSAIGISAILLAAIAQAPFWVFAVLAGVQGIVSAGILGGMRALLVPTVPKSDIEPANAVDAVFVEVAFIAGPAVAGTLALVVGARGVLVAQLISFIIASFLVKALPDRHPQPGGNLIGPAPLRTRGAVPTYVMCLLIGIPVGAWEATMPARLDAFGWDPETAGPLLALTALGSGLAGLLAANVEDPLRRARLYTAVLLGLLALLFIPTALAPSVAILAVALFAFGVPIAPLNTIGGMVFQRTLSEPRQAEGFALYPAAIFVGAGAGQAVAGLALARYAPREVILMAALIPAGMAIVIAGAIIRRRLLGLPVLGMGFEHDPTITDPSTYAGEARA